AMSSVVGVSPAPKVGWPEKMKAFRLGPSGSLVAGLLVLTGLLIAGPLALLLLASLKPAGTMPWDPAALTIRNFVAVFSSPATLRLLINTATYSAGSICFGGVLALALSWLIERTDLPLRRLVYVGQAVTLGLPPMITALGWTLWLSPRIGLANTLLRAISGSDASEGPLNGYSLWGMVFVTGLGICPSMFYMLSPLVGRIDASLEEAAQTAGARTPTIWRRILLPLMLPGLLSVLMYYAVAVSQTFEVPLALGLPSQTLVLSTRVFLLTQPGGGPPDYGLASAYALITLALGLLLMTVFIRTSRHSERFQVVTGKGYRPKRAQLGVWTVPATAFVLGYLLVAVLAPLGLLLWASLLPFYQAPSGQALQSLSLAAYGSVLHNQRVVTAAINTVVLLAGTATLVMGLSLLIAWACVRIRLRSVRLLEGMAFTPLAIPHVLMALGVLLLYARTPIYGTVAIIMLGQVTAYLAYGNRTLIASLPQVKPAMANGWVWVATHSMRDFTFPLMLGTTGNLVVAALIWNFWTTPNLPAAAALSILLAASLGLVAGIARALLSPRR